MRLYFRKLSLAEVENRQEISRNNTYNTPMIHGYRKGKHEGYQ